MIELPELPLPNRPYRGIDFFRFVDQPIFFARDEETRKLMRLVTIYRGSLCFGDSGSGKSSLINAGLIPAMIAEGFLPERIRVQPVPGRECVIERIALTDDGQPPFLPSRFAIEGVDATRLVLAAGDLLDRLPLDSSDDASSGSELAHPLLIFDQFEELITLFEEAPETREKFAEAAAAQKAIIDVLVSLLRSVEGEQARLAKLLFVFRDDYFAKLSKLFARVPNLRDQHLRLTAPTTQALPRIIRGPFETDRIPAGHFSHEISQPLAAKLAEAIEERSESGFINLTEVQIACSTLWQDPRREEVFERGSSKREVVQRLLEAYLESALEHFGKDRAAAITILSHLVTNSGTRNIVGEEDLLNRVTDRDQVPLPVAKRALKDLVEKTRLVRRQRRYETAFYDITSEFLVPWIREERLRRDAAYAAEERAKAGRARTRSVLVGVFALLLLGSLAALGFAVLQRQRAEAEAKTARSATDEAERQRAAAVVARDSESRLRNDLQRQLAGLKESQETTTAATGVENQRAAELLARFVEQARPHLTEKFIQQVQEVEDALRKATETAKSGAEETSTAVEATSVTLKNPNAKPDVKPARDPNVAWAYYGMKNADGTWATRNFKRVSGDDAAMPARDDVLVAQGNVTIRKDVIRSEPGKGFVNASAIGVLKRNQQITVLEVRGPDDEDPADWATIWITFNLPK